jgi:hypothetical protein
MKLLFAVLCFAVSFCATSEAAKPKDKPKQESNAQVEAAKKAEREAADAAPRVPKPGFWERAWDSTKKGTSKIWGTTKKVGSTVASPFNRGGSKTTGEAGWGKLSMSMALDPATVKVGDTRSVKVTVTVVNMGEQPVQLEFPTTQRIEVLIKGDGGKVLAKWSEDQKLDEEQGFMVVNPTEKLEYSATISTREMEAGRTYLVEAYFPNFDQLRSSRTIVPTK